MGRAAALLALVAALVAWYELAPHLASTSRWPSIALIAILVIPALFATAADGHHEVKLCEAVLKSSRSKSWVAV